MRVPPAEFILTLMEWILKHNVFVFEDNFFQQVKGTLVCTKVRQSFFGTLGRGVCIYIDDICMIFEGHETELQSFHAFS